MIPYLPEGSRIPFPPVDAALMHPNGLLCVGADLSPERLLMAYRNGIFPWFGEDEPIMWWSPDPRCVIFPEHIKISRSLRKVLKKQPFELRWNSAFSKVIDACAGPRRDSDETWITGDMRRAYIQLHSMGHAHSLECWQEDELVGGLYGLACGRVFCGESMFSYRADASKVALVHLAQCGHYQLIDCQLPTEHLMSMGATTIDRTHFIEILQGT